MLTFQFGVSKTKLSYIDMKLEPNDIQLVQNALGDTLAIPDIQLIIEEEKVSQEVNIIKVFKKDKKSNSEKLF